MHLENAYEKESNKKTEPQSINNCTHITSVQTSTHTLISLYREVSDCSYSGGSDEPVV